MVRFKKWASIWRGRIFVYKFGDHFLLNYIQRRPRRYHLSSEYTKFAGIPGVIPSLRILVENSPKVFASLRRIPTRSLPSKWKIHGLQRVTKPKKSASQTIPRNPSASFPTKHPSWHQNLTPGGPPWQKLRSHLGAVDLGVAAKRPFCFLGVFLGMID